MARLYPVAGSKIFIGSAAVNAKSAVVAADFAAVTWTEISDWTNAGAIGDTQQIIEQNVISSGRTRKAKGTRNGGTMENQFLPNGEDAGQVKFEAAIDDCRPYPFKIEWGANCPRESVVTVTIADPGVFSWTAHGLAAGTPIEFSTTGALPTGITAGTTYYVVDPTTDAFSVAATPGGAALETTGTQSGVHTASAGEIGMTNLFYGLAMPGTKQGGEANTAQLQSWSIAIDSNIVAV